MAYHSKISPSKFETVANCPGSIAYAHEHGLQEEGRSVYADEGTAAHFFIEKCITENKPPIFYKERIIKVLETGCSMLQPGAVASENCFLVDDDMVESTTVMVEYVLRLAEEYDTTPICETRVYPLPGTDDISGSVDCIIDAWPYALIIVDYKHGRGVYVSVEDNKQLLGYASGVCGRDFEDYELIKMSVVQPRCPDAPNISSQHLSAKKIINFRKELQDWVTKYEKSELLVREGANLDSLYEAGFIDIGEEGKHCTFCKLKGQCPAMVDLVQKQAGIEFSEIPQEITPPDDSARLSEILDWMKHIESWINSVKELAHSKLMQGEEIEGWKLVLQSGKRSYRKDIDVEKIIEQIQEYGLNREQIVEEKLRPFTAIEKSLNPENKIDFNLKILKTPEPKPILVDSSDARLSYRITTPEEDFAGSR